MFVKFPHTPHLAWLAPGRPRADKVLSPEERANFLSTAIVVEEKVDGANIGLSIEDGELLAQNRGEYIRRPAHPQFAPLWPWLAQRQSLLTAALGDGLVLFGEWCYAVHSVRYTSLPDWFLAFDIYDRVAGRYWAAGRRNELLRRFGIAPVPELGRGRYDLGALEKMLAAGSSRIGADSLEGLYLRRERDGWLESRAKLVRAEFVQSIDEHWSGRQLERNRLAAGEGAPR